MGSRRVMVPFTCAATGDGDCNRGLFAPPDLVTALSEAGSHEASAPTRHVVDSTNDIQKHTQR